MITFWVWTGRVLLGLLFVLFVRPTAASYLCLVRARLRVASVFVYVVAACNVVVFVPWLVRTFTPWVLVAVAGMIVWGNHDATVMIRRSRAGEPLESHS